MNEELDIVGVGGNLSILAFVSAVYLSVVIRDRRRPQDTLVIFIYLVYSAGLAFLTAPSVIALDQSLTTPAQALGGLFFGMLMTLVWVMYVEFLSADPGEGDVQEAV